MGLRCITVLKNCNYLLPSGTVVVTDVQLQRVLHAPQLSMPHVGPIARQHMMTSKPMPSWLCTYAMKMQILLNAIFQGHKGMEENLHLVWRW